MAEALTQKQENVLNFLKAEHRRTGLVPSTREIQAHFGFASQTAAMSHLRALERKGAVIRLPGKARAVMFPEDLEREEIVDVPLYGSIAAGFGEDQVENREGAVSIDVATLGVSSKAKTFALKVRGESMIDAHICDGDTVILEHREPRPGDIVAALIDGETTLKRFVMKEGSYYLHAENAEFPDLIPVQELVVQGVMVALLRKTS
ncbi:MAG: transcriptional repressor LexA [Verrucomicrobiota bacterium JB023]|nr:transcriptional repressor LexA [Verrucomicrobiota bacterium JB023]